ncbi:unnamed protein product [Leptosia nina]|uniref:T-box domain-containing protein n=1 Tax=Leptosia nina TaxID=320188 RepID=A0AAV1J9G6_9NEOP
MMMDQAHFSEYLLRQQMLHAASLSGLQHRVGADAEPPACEARLLNGDLWRRFHDIGTEMIITKGGRSVMFLTVGEIVLWRYTASIAFTIRERGVRRRRLKASPPAFLLFYHGSFVACSLRGHRPSLSGPRRGRRVRERGGRAPTSCSAVGRPPRAPPSACSTNNQIMTANSSDLDTTSACHSSMSPEKLTADIHLAIADRIIGGLALYGEQLFPTETLVEKTRLHLDKNILSGT